MDKTGVKWILWITTVVIVAFSAAGIAADIDSLVVTESGNVGIGTTEPGSRLHVNGAIRGNQSGALRIDSGYGYVDIGPKNGGYSHFYTDRPLYYFDREIQVNTGLLGSYDEDLSLRTQGTTRLSILNSNGWVGIGTSNPATNLDVAGVIRASSAIQGGHQVAARASSSAEGGQLTLGYGGNYNWGEGASTWNIDVYNRDLRFFRYNSSASPHVAVQILENGSVGIGTGAPQSTLHVNGTMKVNSSATVGGNLTVSGSVKAQTVSWYTRPSPDYVFEESYRLPPLEEVEQYVKTHKHLPEIPSAAQVAKDGVDLIQMIMGQLKNIEELTLHMIALKKENDALKERLVSLETQLGMMKPLAEPHP